MVIGESFQGTTWIGCSADGNQIKLYPKADYEPVPEDVWKDVTGEARVQGNEVFHGDGTRMYVATHQDHASRYRLVKERLWRCTVQPTLNTHGRTVQEWLAAMGLTVEPVDALRVERKR